MDQIKIGKFIKEMRIVNNLTQKDLADKLNISDKTISKWETGNGLPDVSLMIPLCDALDISVNELLSAGKLDESEYQVKAEENMMTLIQDRQEAKKRFGWGLLTIFITMLASITLFLLVEYIAMPDWLRILLIVIGFVIVIGGVAVACVFEMDSSVFECPRCGEQFKPTTGEFVMSPHTLTTRRLKCPHCGEKSFCRRHFARKNKEAEDGRNEDVV